MKQIVRAAGEGRLSGLPPLLTFQSVVDFTVSTPALFEAHIAIPFPTCDGLYGLEPDPADDFGVNLGTLAAHGEFGGLVLNMNAMLRMSSNPFFPYLLERVAAAIDAPPAR